jgi:uncharacterized C2H2 Zn-finger protein
MEITRLKGLILALIMVAWISPSALAQPKDYLYGTFYLKCPKCSQVDKVEKGTVQHVCEKCHTQMFRDGKVTMMCPKGHPNEVRLHGRTTSIICKECNMECRREK